MWSSQWVVVQLTCFTNEVLCYNQFKNSNESSFRLNNSTDQTKISYFLC